MGVAICLRTSLKNNFFRNTILDIIGNESIDNVILSYPYFQENKSYIKNNKKIKGEYSIVYDGIKEQLLGRTNRNTDFYLNTISANQKGCWMQSYMNFIQHIQGVIDENKLNIDFCAYKMDGLDAILHAKFCIGATRGGLRRLEPVVLVLGSSNMTNRAFGSEGDHKGKFNYESDIVLWDDEKYKFDDETFRGCGLNPLMMFTKENNPEKEYLNYFWNEVHRKFVDENRIRAI